MFMGKNHIHALATAFSSLGGFQQQPKWFKSIKHSIVWQILCLAVYIFQGGGGLDFVYSASLAVLFFTIIYFSNYLELDFIKIERNPVTEPDQTNNDTKSQENVGPEEVSGSKEVESVLAENEIETFHGYPTY